MTASRVRRVFASAALAIWRRCCRATRSPSIRGSPALRWIARSSWQSRASIALSAASVLEARWQVLGHRGPPPVYGQSTLTAASGRDYAVLVATQSRLLGALSAEIAHALRGSTHAEATDPRIRKSVTEEAPATP